MLVINSAPSSSPSIIELGSTPLSNLYFASVFKFNSRAVFLIEVGEKKADSSRMFFVSNSVEVAVLSSNYFIKQNWPTKINVEVWQELI